MKINQIQYTVLCNQALPLGIHFLSLPHHLLFQNHGHFALVYSSICIIPSPNSLLIGSFSQGSLLKCHPIEFFPELPDLNSLYLLSLFIFLHRNYQFLTLNIELHIFNYPLPSLELSMARTLSIDHYQIPSA